METTSQPQDTPTVHAAKGRGALKLQTMTMGKMTLDVVMIGDDLWFYAPSLARTLEYRDAPNMLRGVHANEIAIHTIELSPSSLSAEEVTSPSSLSEYGKTFPPPLSGGEDTSPSASGAGGKTPSMRGKVGTRDATFLNEPGFYRVVARSQSAVAEPFKCWVFYEVLPSLRKTGQYKMQEEAKRMGFSFEYTANQWEWLKMRPGMVDLIPLALAGYNSIEITRMLRYNTKSGITARKQIEKLKELGFLPKVIEPRAKQLERRVKAELAEKSATCLIA